MIITDQGNEFRSPDLDQWFEVNKIERHRTTPYNPQANGKTERMNRTIKTMIAKLTNGNRTEWEDQLGVTLMAIRNNVSVVTGFSPFMLNHVRPARHRVGRMVDGEPDPEWSDRLLTQQRIMTQAAKHTEESRAYNKRRLEQKQTARQLDIGAQVMVRAQPRYPFTARWDHNFIVTGVNGKVVTVLHTPTGRTSRWNRRHVRLVNPDIAWEGLNDRDRVRRAQPRVLPPVADNNAPNLVNVPPATQAPIPPLVLQRYQPPRTDRVRGHRRRRPPNRRWRVLNRQEWNKPVPPPPPRVPPLRIRVPPVPVKDEPMEEDRVQPRKRGYEPDAPNDRDDQPSNPKRSCEEIALLDFVRGFSAYYW